MRLKRLFHKIYPGKPSLIFSIFFKFPKLTKSKLLICLLPLLFILSCSGIRSRESEDSDRRALSQRITSLRTEGPRKRILLLPFINDTIEKDSSIARTGRDALVSGLRMTDNFVILDNSDVPKDLKQYRSEKGYDMEEVSKVAAEMGVVAIVEGKVIDIKVRKSGDDVGVIRSIKAEVFATVGVRVFSASNHREILNEVRSATSESRTHRIAETGRNYSLAADPELIRESLVSACQGMILPITKSVDKLSWNGKVAMVGGDRIYLNAGRITGLNIGDILRVSEDGEEIYDPDSGVLIGRAPGRMKGTLEVVSYFGKDGAITVIHSGSGFKENDKVELY